MKLTPKHRTFVTARHVTLLLVGHWANSHFGGAEGVESATSWNVVVDKANLNKKSPEFQKIPSDMPL